MLNFVINLRICGFLKDFDNDTKSDCIGLEISAMSVLESEESYVNILLGDYEEPEVEIENVRKQGKSNIITRTF